MTAATLPLRGGRSLAGLVDLLRPVIAIGVPLLLWETAARLGWINDFLFPPPSAIFAALWRQAGPESNPPFAIFWHVALSLYRLLAGVGLALALGTVLGLLIGLTRWGRAIFKPIISAVMPVPTLAWTPVLMLVLGIDNRTTITVVLIATSFEIIYNVIAGVEMLSLRTFWVVRSMGATRRQILTKVILPGIMPYLLTGLRLGIGYAWRALIAAEMLAASSFGLGFMIFNASEYLSMDVIYGGIMTIAVLGYAIENLLVGRLEAATVRRWGVQVER